MKAFFDKQKLIRALSMLLVIATLWSVLEPAVVVFVLSAEAEKPYVTMNDERISEVVLEEGAKFNLEAGYAGEASAYQWQIEEPTEEI